MQFYSFFHLREIAIYLNFFGIKVANSAFLVHNTALNRTL